jgi:Xaa-Pro aminopeptidase
MVVFSAMSTMGGGTPSSQYDNLSALLKFVESPDYVDRIKELKDLEESSLAAKAAADEAQAKLDAAFAEHGAKVAEHEAAAEQLAADRQAHDDRVARWNVAMQEVAKALE